MNEEIRNLQKKQLKMLKIFIKICEENKLRYFLAGGSALGAVRHKGFIPWDDDIDVSMPRPDYNKFMEIAQDKLPKHLFLQNQYTEKDYNLTFAKIRDSKTTFIEKRSADLNINKGVFIDIFPIDGIGNDLESASKTFYQFRKIREKFRFKLGMHKKDGLRNKVRFVYYTVLTTFDSFAKGLKTANDYAIAIDEFCNRINYKDSSYVIIYEGGAEEREIMKKTVYGTGSKIKFEKTTVSVPKKVDTYLKALYNNYMELPPVEKRVAGHYQILDLEKSYKEYEK